MFSHVPPTIRIRLSYVQQGMLDRVRQIQNDEIARGIQVILIRFINHSQKSLLCGSITWWYNLINFTQLQILCVVVANAEREASLVFSLFHTAQSTKRLIFSFLIPPIKSWSEHPQVRRALAMICAACSFLISPDLVP